MDSRVITLIGSSIDTTVLRQKLDVANRHVILLLGTALDKGREARLNLFTRG